MFRNKKLYILLVFMFFVSTSAVSRGYSYFDTTDENDIPTFNLGAWDFYLELQRQFTIDMTSYVDNKLLLDPTSKYGYIYTQTDAPDNQTATIYNIDLYGYTWEVWGKSKSANLPTMGYLSLVDRAKDSSNTPIHDINTAYFAVAPFPEYNYFVAYDAMNNITNNRFSIRFNYNSKITSKTTIGQISNVTFYAMVGLSDPDDLAIMRSNQNVIVDVSPNGSTWTNIGKTKPPIVGSESEAFNFYSFDVPASLLGQDLYLRIRYNGRATVVSGSIAYGRLILDELIINFN